MPNIVSHYLFAKALYQEFCPDDSIKSKSCFLYGNEEYLTLATQGPDMFFFYGRLPWVPHYIIGSKDYGNQLHDADGSVFLEELCKECDSIRDEKERNAFRTFTFGCLCHILLDRETHPYTYYETGFDKGHPVRHSAIESAYGTWQANHLGHPELIRKPWLCLAASKTAFAVIDKHLMPVMERVFKRRFPSKMYSVSVRSYRQVLKFINCPLSKPFRFGVLKTLRMKDQVGDDAMNLNHELWLDPATGTEHHESFLELFDIAKGYGEQSIKLAMDNGFGYDALKPFINGQNYEGYLPTAKMRFHSANETRIDW